jgi:hypothetical protein
MKAKNYLFHAIGREILETILDKGTSKAIWCSMKQKFRVYEGEKGTTSSFEKGV